eukprot:160172-Chlamydomonas_euryale.AAC.2
MVDALWMVWMGGQRKPCLGQLFGNSPHHDRCEAFDVPPAAAVLAPPRRPLRFACRTAQQSRRRWRGQSR